MAAEAGLDLVNRCGDPRRWYIPESNGCGAAWLDFDGDGDMDLFVGNGSTMRYVEDGRRLEVLDDGESRLYRNEGGMNFRDVTTTTGASRTDWVNALATGDVDNDGDPDLYLGCLEEDVFLELDGKRYVDSTESAGLGNELWAAGVAFGDANRDGNLDLYVANYCLFDLDNPPAEGKRAVYEGVEVAYGPEGENKQGINPGAPDRFYFGDGQGGFRESTQAAGFELEKALCSYACVFTDVDDDGWVDLAVANDLQPANLFMNLGNGRFEDQGQKRGFAFTADGQVTSGMGLFVDDIDGDGDFDVLRTNFDHEPNSLHVNDGNGHFTERTAWHGLSEASMDRLGWGGGFFDADLDGDLDLLIANGHVFPQAEEIGMNPWEQITQVYEATPDKDRRIHYEDVTARTGSGLSQPRSARGVALADADDDGDVDALVIDIDERPRLLENRSLRKGHWISIRLVGTWSNRDGYGAKVTVRSGKRFWVREMRTSQGLYSAHDPRLHFGVGNVRRIDSVEVRWPNGIVQRIENPPLDNILTIEERESR